MNTATVITIIRVPESGQYFFNLEIPPAAPFALQATVRTPATLADTTILSSESRNQLNEIVMATVESLRFLYAQTNQVSGEKQGTAVELLERLGRFMFNYILPLPMRHAVRNLSADVPIIIATNDTQLPWELLHTGQHYLALKHVVGRQIMSARPTQLQGRINRHERPFLFIDNPTGDLPESSEEVENLVDASDAALDYIVAKRLSYLHANKTAVLQELSSGVYDLIHYSGHASPKGLELADGILTLAELDVLGGHPFIFLNACRSIREVADVLEDETIERAFPVLQGYSLAESFINQGAVGLIGTLWDVFDEGSRHFAEQFYARVLKGISVGEALRQVRGQLHQENPNDPLWASFALYGDPSLRIAGFAQREARPLTMVAIHVPQLPKLFNQYRLAKAARIQEELLDSLIKIAHYYGGEVDSRSAQMLTLRFGLPKAREDDAERAVQTALEIRQHLQEFNQQQSLPFFLQLKIGISTDRVIGWHTADVEYRMAGKPLSLATQLAQHAPPDQILTDEATYRLAHQWFLFDPAAPFMPEQEAEPIDIYQLSGIKQADYILTEMVGREVELNQLMSWWSEVRKGQSRIVGVVGEAGIGKTRLLQALPENLSAYPHAWLQTQSQSFHQNHPYALLVQLIRGLLAVRANDDVSITRHKLEQALQEIERQHTGKTRFAGMTTEGLVLLGQVIGLSYSDPVVDNLEPELRLAKLAKHLRNLLIWRTQQNPLVVVMEDLHWIDEISLSVLNQVFETLPQIPIFVVVTYRPHWSNHWPQGRHYRFLPLEELNPEAQQSLLRNLLEAYSLPDSLTIPLLQKTGGNPFYIEEMLRALQENQVQDKTAVDLDLLNGVIDKNVSDLIERVILARITHLAPPSHTILQQAAVIGNPFSYELLAAIQDDPQHEVFEQHLNDLLARQFVRAKDGWSTEYYFHHGLIQYVVYEKDLFNEKRRQLHRQVAQAMRRLYGDDDSAILLQIAYHYEQSDDRVHAIQYSLRAAERTMTDGAKQTTLNWYRYALEKIESFAIQPLTDLEEMRGGSQERIAFWHIAALEGAGDVASAMGNKDEALAQYGQALRLAEGLDDFAQTRVAELYRKTAVAHHDKGAFIEAQTNLNHGLALLDEQVCFETGRIYIWIGLLHFRQGRLTEGLQSCQQAIAIIEQIQNLRDLAQAYNLQGLIHRNMGSSYEALVAHEKSAELYQQANYKPGLERAISNRGCVFQDLGEWQKALADFKQSNRLSTETGEIWRQAAAAINLGEIYRRLGELDEALHVYKQAQGIAKKFEYSEMLAMTLMDLGIVYLQQGKLTQARGYLEESCDTFERLGSDVHLPECLRYLAELHLQQGNLSQALSLAQEALAQSVKLARRLEEGQAHRVLGHIHQLLEKWDEADAHLQHSLIILEAQKTKHEVGLTLLALAILHQARGKNDPTFYDEGQMCCQRAIDIFEQLGAQPDLSLAKKTLAILSQDNHI